MSLISAAVEAQTIAGAVTLVWHNGETVHAAGTGWADVARGVPLQRDSLFRIASMTKPITAVAALTLLEEGAFELDEPITRWAPEFAAVRVLRSPEASLTLTDAAQRPITFRDLLTHRSGLTYGDLHTGAIAQAYQEAIGPAIDNELSPEAWVARLASLPLLSHPGSRMHYGHSTDLLGFLISRMEGASLEQVLRRRILDPLGMTDTGFSVPSSNAHSRATLYGHDPEGRLIPRVICPGGSTMHERPPDMQFTSGGQGLWSTVDDYLAFARLFVQQGSVDGVRILRPETVALMTANQLCEAQRANASIFGMPLLDDGHGFGLGLAVVLDEKRAGSTPCGGSAGSCGWPGAFGGWWRADPRQKAILILLCHNAIEREQFASGVGLGVYDVIDHFQQLAAPNT